MKCTTSLPSLLFVLFAWRFRIASTSSQAAVLDFASLGDSTEENVHRDTTTFGIALPVGGVYAQNAAPQRRLQQSDISANMTTTNTTTSTNTTSTTTTSTTFTNTTTSTNTTTTTTTTTSTTSSTNTTTSTNTTVTTTTITTTTKNATVAAQQTTSTTNTSTTITSSTLNITTIATSSTLSTTNTTQPPSTNATDTTDISMSTSSPSTADVTANGNSTTVGSGVSSTNPATDSTTPAGSTTTEQVPGVSSTDPAPDSTDASTTIDSASTTLASVVSTPVTKIGLDVVVDDATAYNLTAHRLSILQVMQEKGVDISDGDVSVEITGYAVAVQYSIAGTFTEAQAKQAVATTVQVPIAAVAVVLSGRRLGSLRRSLRRLATSLTATITTNDPVVANSVKAAVNDTGVVKQNLIDAGGTVTSDPVVQTAPSVTVQTQTTLAVPLASTGSTSGDTSSVLSSSELAQVGAAVGGTVTVTSVSEEQVTSSPTTSLTAASGGTTSADDDDDDFFLMKEYEVPLIDDKFPLWALIAAGVGVLIILICLCCCCRCLCCKRRAKRKPQDEPKEPSDAAAVADSGAVTDDSAGAVTDDGAAPPVTDDRAGAVTDDSAAPLVTDDGGDQVDLQPTDDSGQWAGTEEMRGKGVPARLRPTEEGAPAETAAPEDSGAGLDMDIVLVEGNPPMALENPPPPDEEPDLEDLRLLREGVSALQARDKTQEMLRQQELEEVAREIVLKQEIQALKDRQRICSFTNTTCFTNTLGDREVSV